MKNGKKTKAQRQKHQLNKLNLKIGRLTRRMERGKKVDFTKQIDVLAENARVLCTKLNVDARA